MNIIKTIDWSINSIQSVTIAGPTGSPPPQEKIEIVFANPVEGTTYTLEVKQSLAPDSVPITASWNTDILFSGGEAPFLTLKKGAVDVFTFVYSGINYTNLSFSPNILPT